MQRFLLACMCAMLTMTAACGDKKPASQAVAVGSTVLALGDSLTYGTGADADTAYPAVLAQSTGWNIINAGVSGDTSAQALERLPSLLATHEPKLVIVSIGGNDFLRKFSPKTTQANITAICQQVLDSGAQVVLVAVPELSFAAVAGYLSDHSMYAEIADTLNIPLLKNAWSAVLADEGLRSDAIHANAQGYAQFAKQLHAAVVDIGLLRN